MLKTSLIQQGVPVTTVQASPAPSAAQQRLALIGHLNQRASREERHTQLVKLASYIVEFEGLDALKHQRLAELAGCGRPLIYSYFPRRSDIYIAVSEAFYQRLDAAFSCEQQYSGLVSGLSGDGRLSAEMEALIWDVVDEYGCGGLILRCIPELNEDFQQYQQTLISRYEYRWLRYFDALGIGDNAARLLLENCTAITKNYALAYGRGELDRPAAISAVLKSLAALISAELPAR